MNRAVMPPKMPGSSGRMQAVQLASEHMHSGEQDDQQVSAYATSGMGSPGERYCENSDNRGGGLVAEYEYKPAHSNSIHIDEHDREMQRLLVTEKVGLESHHVGKRHCRQFGFLAILSKHGFECRCCKLI